MEATHRGIPVKRWIGAERNTEGGSIILFTETFSNREVAKQDVCDDHNAFIAECFEEDHDEPRMVSDFDWVDYQDFSEGYLDETSYVIRQVDFL